MTHFGNRVAQLTETFRSLLDAKSVLYRDWPPTDTSEIKTAHGVYHFFNMIDGKPQSLYIGKGTVSKNGWSLYKRISQHFQPSQTNSLPGHYSSVHGVSIQEAINTLRQGEIFVQWLCLPSHTDAREVASIENFAKAILNPKYTKE